LSDNALCPHFGAKLQKEMNLVSKLNKKVSKLNMQDTTVVLTLHRKHINSYNYGKRKGTKRGAGATPDTKL
jgi:hypothetical protein